MNPILVEVYRKNIVESTHSGSVVAIKTNGDIVLGVGDIDRHIYPRSAIKLFQTLPLVESGAAKAFNLSDSQVALACASHSGENQHIKAISKWLAILHLNQTALRNGPDFPFDEQARNAYIAQGGTPSKIHHNCSGKHIGMLTLSKHLNYSLENYDEHKHATQRTWMQCFCELADIDVTNLPWERDGCGLPAVYMPMQSLALAAAKYSNNRQQKGIRKAAMQRIISAVQKHPQMIAGSTRCCSAVIAVSQGNIIVKAGAEGVYMGFILDQQVGFALKADCGANRASEVILGGLLEKLKALNKSQMTQLNRFFRPAILNSQDKETGHISSAF